MLELTPEGKEQIPTFDKIMVIYKFECYFDNSYIGLTTIQLTIRVKDHILACIDNFLKLAQKEKKSNKITNAVKKSAIAEHLVNNQSFSESFDLKRFKIIKSYCKVFDFVKMEAICILNRKPTLCRQKEFDYSVALFT